MDSLNSGAYQGICSTEMQFGSAPAIRQTVLGKQMGRYRDIIRRRERTGAAHFTEAANALQIRHQYIDRLRLENVAHAIARVLGFARGNGSAKRATNLGATAQILVGHRLFEPAQLECLEFAPSRLASDKPGAIQFGYFCLLILYRDRLVGRLDCKAHRADARFEVKSAHIERAVGADFEELLAAAPQSFATFNACDRVDLAGARPDNFANLPSSLTDL